MSHAATAAIVLAGGLSRRMGQPKAWLPFGERTFLQQVVDVARTVAAECVVLAAPDQALPPLPGDVRMLVDRMPSAGPLASLADAWETLPLAMTRVLVLSCDLPFLTADVAAKLIASCTETAAAVPTTDGRRHPLLACYPRSAGDVLVRLHRQHERRLQRWVDLLPLVELPESTLRTWDPGLVSFQNINTPSDLDQARQRMLETARSTEVPPMSHVVSIQVGLPTTYDNDSSGESRAKPWTTAFFKTPVAGPVVVGPLGLAGDGQADLENHGGVDKAVLCYDVAHYAVWQQESGLPGQAYGGFGENLTVVGFTESTVCIGDQFRCGSTVLEVTQPRQPCWKLARRWQITDLAARVIQNGRSGWYLRVIVPGTIAPGDRIERVAHPHPEWTVARAHQVMHFGKRAEFRGEIESLLALPQLSQAWQDSLRRRLEKFAGDTSHPESP